MGRIRDFLQSPLLSGAASLVAVLGIPALFVATWLGYFQLRDVLTKPELELHLASPRDVSLRVFNSSSVVARDAGISVNLWDLHVRAATAPEQFGRGSDPGNLLIGNQSLGYIRPRSAVGPYTLSSWNPRLRDIPAGHVLFGLVTVRCPECETRTYWVLVKTGEAAWSSEVMPGENVIDVLGRVLRAGPSYAEAITEVVPRDRRISASE